MVELLLKHGADPNQLYGESPDSVLWQMQYSEENVENYEEINKARLEIAERLLRYGANPHTIWDNADLLEHANEYWWDDEGIQSDYRGEFISLLEKFDDMASGKQKTVGRVDELNKALLCSVKPIFRLRKIGISQKERKKEYAYTISFARDYKHSLEEMVREFYRVCGELVRGEEVLTAEGKAFKIASCDFEVFYYIEAWRKSADKIAYMEDGVVKIEQLHRMSCEQAAYVFKKHRIDPLELMHKIEALQKYDNHADKYTALAKAPLLLTATQAAISNK